ncbi:putative Glycosyltransferase involved in cell wall biogenesis [Vibrio cholerae]|nr:putative glycosyltransferase [Vibrio cholerae]GHX97475.1 putative Glycosyltransferase involved in cell wall biogenesis [Vibrio cholerae]
MISYLITVKNGEEFITSLLENLSQQILGFDRVELIIVDDGSSDSTVEKVTDYQLDELNIKLIKTSGVGRSKALNLALKSAIGDYVGIMDVDDISHPMKTFIQIRKLLDSNLDILFTNYKSFYGNNIPCNKNIDMEDVKSIEVLEVPGHKLLIRNPFFHSSMVLKRSILNNLGGYDESLSRLVDYDLYFRAYSQGLKFGVIQEKLTYKRLHANQSFERNNRYSYIYAVLKMQLKWVVKLKEYNYLVFPFIKYFYSLMPIGLRKFVDDVRNG